MDQSSFDVFDCHQHMGSTGDAHGIVVPGSVRGATIVDDEVATRLRFMDQGGIRQAIAIPGHNDKALVLGGNARRVLGLEPGSR